MEPEVIINLIGSLGLPGAILILLIFLAHKHLPGLIGNLEGIKVNLATLSVEVALLLSKIDKNEVK